MALGLWVTCTLLELPNYFHWGGHAFDPKTMACSYDRTANYSYTLFFVLVTIGPPLATVAVCYLKVFLHVRKSRKRIEKAGGNITTGKSDTNRASTKGVSREPSTFTSSEIQLAKTLFIIYVAFLICWAPYAVVVLVDMHDTWPKVVYVVAIQMAHTNSSLNSIIYAACNRDFRTGYRMVLDKCFLPVCRKEEEMIDMRVSGSSAASTSTVDVEIRNNKE